MRGPAAPTIRIALTEHGALNPLVRSSPGDATRWGRFDTLGTKTIYSADNRATAYLEILASYRASEEHLRTANSKIAAVTGGDLDAFIEQVFAEWAAKGHAPPLELPASFREDRALYQVRYRDGWWIDISHRNTLFALSPPGKLWRGQSPDPTQEPRLYGSLTTSDMTGDDRLLTTNIAQHLLFEKLEDGTMPLGIRFTSKHGSASNGNDYCWAHWQRPGRKAVDVIGDPIPIDADDPDFLEAQRLSGVTVA